MDIFYTISPKVGVYAVVCVVISIVIGLIILFVKESFHK